MESLISITNSTITCSFRSNNQIQRSDKLIVMSGETSPDIRRYSYLSSALVNYVIGIFLMEERKDEREKREHILVCFIVFFWIKRLRRKNQRKVLTLMYLTLYYLVRSDRNCTKNRRLWNLSSMRILRFLKVLNYNTTRSSKNLILWIDSRSSKNLILRMDSRS